MQKIGYADLYHFYNSDHKCQETDAIYKLNTNDMDKDPDQYTMHFKNLRYIVKKTNAFKGSISDEIKLILETTDIYKEFLKLV